MNMINRYAFERALANFRGRPGGSPMDERQRRAMFARGGRGGGGGGGRASTTVNTPSGPAEPAARAIARGRAQMNEAQIRARVRNGTATPSEYEDVTGQKYPGAISAKYGEPGRIAIDEGGIRLGRIPIDGGGRTVTPEPMPPHLRYAPGSEGGTKHPDHNTPEYQAWFKERQQWERANYPITVGLAPWSRLPVASPSVLPKKLAVADKNPPVRNFVPLARPGGHDQLFMKAIAFARKG